MGSPSLQTHQDPILLMPWLCFRELSKNPGFPSRRPETSNYVGCPERATRLDADTAPAGVRRRRGAHTSTRREVEWGVLLEQRPRIAPL
jgi:hypothetical protein